MNQKSTVRSAETTRPARLHNAVVEQLAQRIVGGYYKPGDVLPNEADLCAELMVGRSSIREAVRVLADKGLLSVRPRIGTRVLPPSAWKRLDSDLIRWSAQGKPDPAFLSALLEARRIFEPAAAELAARRATAKDLAAIEAGYVGMVEASRQNDLVAGVEADIAFHRALLKGTGNPILAEFESIIEAALRSAFRYTTEASSAYNKTLDAHGDVLDAVRMRDTERARQTMRSLLDVAEADLSMASKRMR